MSRHVTVVLLLAIVLLLSSHMIHGQHWSYGLRPGGKREVESLQESYAEVPNEVSFTELQHLECSIPQNRISLVRDALMNWLEGENARKKI
uniref:Progonadoliberin-1 n=1 Tax=Aquarana catesbeiana TaxID=8400 RepID=GON1_AQUCT|nr:RecName: Full=Progonadoliberin-1; AltName: Full=Progonadoliberin I; Contains: RecName: Full=Gonadoliberin-1; AltName: Full=Gonadoliberin I; AltName: Full=Gonadotropin-releasing hormone I; Short=GnRH I; AltName: Full=LHRH I; AltName: Full=Luliberin I; AltName: Full=Luteinizing hormone-releasing hormone I; Contains: RecName: Full=GnRH-associated peptide 1; AltName: Full=GAP1; AltName: Full=GnRH-associated peptide I; Flags: Precursor [Aquarana catesbeiana]AAL05972.1 gonadotropin-releasing hormone 